MSGRVARKHCGRAGRPRAVIGAAIVLASGSLLAAAPGARAATASPTAVPSGWSGARTFPLLVVNGGGTISDIGPDWDVTLPVGYGPTDVGVTPDGQDAYVTSEDGTVSVIRDVQTLHPKVIKSLTVGEDPTAVAVTPNSRYAYVVNRGDHTVSVIADADTASPTVITTLRLSAVTAPSAPWYITITPNGKEAYVSLDDGSLAIIDGTESGKPVVASKPLAITKDGDIADIAMTPDGRYAYVAEDSASGGVLDIVDDVQTSSPRLVRRWNIGTNLADQVAVTPDGKYAYVADSTDKVLVITNPETTDPVISKSPIPVGGFSDQVAVQPDGDYASVMTCNSDFCDGLTEIAGASTAHPKASASWSPGTGLQTMAFVNLGMAALGDSYSSGNGTRGATGDCLRSPQAWPKLLPGIVGGGAISASVRLIACSGADSTSASVAPEEDLPAQIAELRTTNPVPDLVTVTVGGDDGRAEESVGFRKVLTACATDVISKNCLTLIRKELGWLTKKEPALLRQDFSAIRGADQSAIVLAVGYPQIFPDTKCLAFSEDATKDMNYLTTVLDGDIASAAKDVPGVEYVDALGVFSSHLLCSKDPDVVPPLTVNSDTGLHDWLHPTEVGQRAIAEKVATFLTTKP